MVEIKVKTERRLAVLYFIVSVFGLILSILMIIIWNYWKHTLNTCVDLNCGCLLFATTSFNAFTGSDRSVCKFVIFAPLFAILWGVPISIYYAYRVCILKQPESDHRRPTVSFHNPETSVNQKRKKSPLYIFLFVMSLSFVLMYLTIGIIMTDGYYTACEGYRKSVVKQLSANGNLAAMVYDRMTCGTIFDFLDYMQPDPTFLEMRFRRGTFLINSGILMQVSILMSWLSFFCWIAISYFNSMSIYKDQKGYLCFKK